MAIVTKHQSFIASVEISIPEDSDFVRNAALEIVLPDTLKKFDHPLGLARLQRSMGVSNFGNFVLVHFAVPEGMTAEHINEGAQILRSNFVADLSDYLLGHAMKDIENVRIANGLHRPESTRADSLPNAKTIDGANVCDVSPVTFARIAACFDTRPARELLSGQLPHGGRRAIKFGKTCVVEDHTRASAQDDPLPQSVKDLIERHEQADSLPNTPIRK